MRQLFARRRGALFGLVGIAPDVRADHPQLQRQGDESLLRPVVQVTLEPAALGVTRRHDPLARRLHLGQPGFGLGQQPLVLQRHRRRGPHGLDHLRVVVERRVVDDRRHLTTVVLDRRRGAIRRDRRHQHRPAGGVGVPGGAREPIGQHERRVAERSSERCLQRLTAHPAQLAEELREPAAGQPRAQQTGQERRGHDEHRRVRDHDHRLRPRALDEIGPHEPHEHQHARCTRDAGQQRSPPRRRRAAPPCGDHAARGDAEHDDQSALSRVDGAVERLAREGQQHIARLLDEQHRDDVEDERRDEDPGHDEPLDPGLQPPAGDEREHQRHERRRPDVLQHLARRQREAGVDLLEQQRDEQTEPGRRHQQAAAAVRPAMPRDQPERRERTPDQAIDDVCSDDLRVTEDDRHERAERGRDRQCPHDGPEPGPACPSREATQHSCLGLVAGMPRRPVDCDCFRRPACAHSVLLAGLGSNLTAASGRLYSYSERRWAGRLRPPRRRFDLTSRSRSGTRGERGVRRACRSRDRGPSRSARFAGARSRSRGRSGAACR